MSAKKEKIIAQIAKNEAKAKEIHEKIEQLQAKAAAFPDNKIKQEIIFNKVKRLEAKIAFIESKVKKLRK